jgi:hypothetical protein
MSERRFVSWVKKRDNTHTHKKKARVNGFEPEE